MSIKIKMLYLIVMVISSLFITSYSTVPVRCEAPLIFYPIEDTFVDSSNATQNYGDYLSLWVGSLEYGEIKLITYLIFDLSPLNSSLFQIVDAELRLHTYDVWETTTIGVHLCHNSSWDEMDITWLNRPEYNATATTTQVISKNNTWYSWNITPLVSENLGKNLSIALISEYEGYQLFVDFDSKEFGVDQSPRIEIYYTIIPEFSALSFLGLTLTTTGTIAILKFKTRRSKKLDSSRLE